MGQMRQRWNISGLRQPKMTTSTCNWLF